MKRDAVLGIDRDHGVGSDLREMSLDVGEIDQQRAVEANVILPLAEVDDGIVAERRWPAALAPKIKASLPPPLRGFSIGTSARGRTLCI